MKRPTKLLIASSLILLVYLLLTDPNELPAALLMVPFVLLFGVLYLACSLVLDRYAVFRPRRIRLGLLIAAIPVLLLVLQSLGQLTFRDSLALFALLIVAYFYVVRFDARAA